MVSNLEVQHIIRDTICKDGNAGELLGGGGGGIFYHYGKLIKRKKKVKGVDKMIYGTMGDNIYWSKEEGEKINLLRKMK